MIKPPLTDEPIIKLSHENTADRTKMKQMIFTRRDGVLWRVY